MSRKPDDKQPHRSKRAAADTVMQKLARGFPSQWVVLPATAVETSIPSRTDIHDAGILRIVCEDASPLSRLAAAAIDQTKDTFVYVCGMLRADFLYNDSLLETIRDACRRGVKFVIVSGAFIDRPTADTIKDIPFLRLLETRNHDRFLFANLRCFIRDGFPPFLHYMVVDSTAAFVEALHLPRAPKRYVQAYCAATDDNLPVIKALKDKTRFCTGLDHVHEASAHSFALVDDFMRSHEAQAAVSCDERGYHPSNNPDVHFNWIDEALAREVNPSWDVRRAIENARSRVDPIANMAPKQIEAFERHRSQLAKKHQGLCVAWFNGRTLIESDDLEDLQVRVRNTYGALPVVYADFRTPSGSSRA